MEHNGEVEKRAAIRSLLEASGYRFIRSVLFDDVYEWDKAGSSEATQEEGEEAQEVEMEACPLPAEADAWRPCWGYKVGWGAVQNPTHPRKHTYVPYDPPFPAAHHPRTLLKSRGQPCLRESRWTKNSSRKHRPNL